MAARNSRWPVGSLVAALALFGCGTVAQAAVAVSITPSYAQMVPGETLQFSATVSGGSNGDIRSQVDNANGGGAASGTVSADGLFTAPQALPDPAIATVTAVSKSDPSVSATATVTLMAQAANGSTYYVATKGNDSNPGTRENPWLTIQHAAKVAVAGDTVLVRGGIYNESVAFPSSGNIANGYITFEGYPGETAVLDGAGLDIPNGQWGLFTFKDVSYVVAEGFELRNYKTASLKDVPIGIYVLGAGHGLQIVNNRIHNIETEAKTNPRQCGSDAFGLTVYGTKAPQAIDSIAISGNEISQLKTGCSETLSLDGNVKNFAVVNNLVHDNDNIAIGAIGFEGVSPDPAYDQARDGEIRGNTVYNISSYGNPDYGRQYAADGIYVDGGTRIVIEQNLVHHTDLGIELASEHLGRVTSRVTARNNVVYGANSAGISIGGYGAKHGGTDHCMVVNNTLFGNDTKKTGSGEFQIQFHATDNLFENNIAYATMQGLLINDFTARSPDPAALNYNLHFSRIGADKAKFVWQGRLYRGYDAYLAGTGNDSRSPPFSNPDFENIDDPPDLDIHRSSPAIDAGIVLDATIVGTDDFAGEPRAENGTIDIGAYER